jgi:hypothetical protein
MLLAASHGKQINERRRRYPTSTHEFNQRESHRFQRFAEPGQEV